jgi:hypothetical protein
MTPDGGATVVLCFSRVETGVAGGERFEAEKRKQ